MCSGTASSDPRPVEAIFLDRHARCPCQMVIVLAMNARLPKIQLVRSSASVEETVGISEVDRG